MLEDIKKAKTNDKKAIEKLLKEYEYIIQAQISKFYVKGMEKDDLEQEASIAFLDAIKSFDPNENDNFTSFCSLCIERRLITLLKSSKRQKNIPLNTSFSFDTNLFLNDDNISLLDLLESKEETTEEKIIKEERLKHLKEETKKILSSFEQKVLEEYLKGFSYKEIADKLKTNEKAIDNAIQRIRNKLKNKKLL